MYETGLFYSEESFRDNKGIPLKNNSVGLAPNNEFVTWYLICTHKKFKLNNKKQVLEDVTVYSNGEFEFGNIFSKYHTRHCNFNSWRVNENQTTIKKIKDVLDNNEIFWILTNKMRNKIYGNQTSFYKYKDIIGK